MQVQDSLPTVSVKNIIERISTTRQITRLDQRLLMAALLTKDSLDEEEQNLINRMYDDIKRGWIWIGD